jgi:hypothetical protein
MCNNQNRRVGPYGSYSAPVTEFQTFSSTPNSQAHADYFLSLISHSYKTIDTW